MIVLGVDPGIANTGYGIVSSSGSRLQALEFGVIQTSPRVAPEARLAEIHGDIGELIARFDVDAVAVEDLYFGVNVASAMAVGQARGVVLLSAGQRGIPVRAYTPQQVKAAVCGSGRADKQQVARMAARLLALAAPPRPDHAADALAVAVCDVSRAPLAGAIAGAVA
ncbi:MAG TPA: crossover junction endodeoxyribonuclease RuvC [Solirubrobacteraceae bacterium]|jgi:crossover junction endodeoxyribonuclease RuvC|nr:crossover junction endodeoxyribonuclease RuvC [Solirubrobacteraceae bacterium]